MSEKAESVSETTEVAFRNVAWKFIDQKLAEYAGKKGAERIKASYQGELEALVKNEAHSITEFVMKEKMNVSAHDMQEMIESGSWVQDIEKVMDTYTKNHDVEGRPIIQ